MLRHLMANQQGNAADPFYELKDALENVRLQTGQAIYLLAGTHPLTASALVAAAKGSVLVAPCGGPLAATIDLTGAQVADGAGDRETALNTLYIDGAGARIEDVVILSRPVTRTSPQRFTYPLGMGRVWVRAASPANESANATFKRCIVGNLTDILSYEQNAGGVVAEDCIFYDNGWDATETYDGEHIYTQNLEASPTKVFRRNLFGRCFGLAVQQYSETTGRIWNYLFEDITLLSEFYALSGVSRKHNALRRLVSWKNRISNGRLDQTQFWITTDACYVAGADIIIGRSAYECAVTGNTLVRLDDAGEMFIGESTDATLVVDNNHYYGNVLLTYAGTARSWAQWQALGFDAHGTYSADLPTENAVFVVASDGTGYVLGQVTIYNWTSADEVTVDLATLGVENGQQVKLRSIDDPLADVRTLAVTGTSVTVDMTLYDADTNPTGRTQSVPIGHDAPLTPAMDIRFGAWRIEAA